MKIFCVWAICESGISQYYFPTRAAGDAKAKELAATGHYSEIALETFPVEPTPEGVAMALDYAVNNRTKVH